MGKGYRVCEKVFTKDEFDYLKTLQQINGAEYFLGENVLWESEGKRISIMIKSYTEKKIKITKGNEVYEGVYVSDVNAPWCIDIYDPKDKIKYSLIHKNGGTDKMTYLINNELVDIYRIK